MDPVFSYRVSVCLFDWGINIINTELLTVFSFSCYFDVMVWVIVDHSFDHFIYFSEIVCSLSVLGCS